MKKQSYKNGIKSTKNMDSLEKIMSAQMQAMTQLMTRQLGFLKALKSGNHYVKAPGNDDIKSSGKAAGKRDVLYEEMTHHARPLTGEHQTASTGYQVYPVSSAQWRMFVLNQLDGEQSSYLLTGATLIEGHLDMDRFKLATQSIIDRHDILRTGFEMRDGSLVQKVHQHIEPELLLIERPGQNPDDIIDDLIKDFSHPFDLSRAPVFRGALVKLSDNRFVALSCTHHIIMDGLSLNIYTQDFMRLYNGQPLPPLTLQYKDYTEWSRRQLETENLKQQQAYWVDKFSGTIPVLNLPTDYPRPLMRSPAGDILYFSVPEPDTEPLRDIARRHKATMTMLFLAAFNVLLHKLTGQTDITIGIPVSGRPPGEFQYMLGMFANTLAMRNQLAAGQRFSDFLKDLRVRSIQDYHHQDYPLEILVDKLDLVRTQRDMSRNALFDALLTYERADDRILQIENLTFKPYEIKKETSMFDLTLEIIEQQGQLNMSMEYCTALFRRDTIKRWAGYFRRILKEIANNVDVLISDIQILSDQERHRLLIELNDTDGDFPNDKTVVDLFRDQVRQTPDHPAVIYRDICLTYKQIDEITDRIACYLIDHYQIQSEDRIGLLFDRSEQMVLGVLAALKSGGAYVPMDAIYPPERIHHIVQNSGCRVLLTEKIHLGITASLPADSVPVVDIRKIDVPADSMKLDAVKVTPDSPAYVIYTSGSTGVPKGVIIEHRNLVNAAYAWRKAYTLDRFEVRLMQMVSMAFDVFAGDILRVFPNGGQMIICPAETRIDLPELYQLMSRHQINIFESTPALILPLMDYIYENGLDIHFLKVLILGSDSLQSRHYKKLINRFGQDMRIINSFGITECTIDSSYFENPDFDETQIPMTPIAGTILQNTRCYVLDENQKLVPVGVTGELYIGGQGLARGYLNNDELTRQRFVPSPFEPGKRLYKTGDGARRLWNGDIEFLGRLDNQVQIRGYRVELEEIENRLLEHESVSKAIVLARDLGNNDMELVSYIVPHQQANPLNVEKCRSYLSEFLPEYMIPTYYVFMDHVPLTPNGKVDRNALPAPDTSSGTSNADYVPPTTLREQKIVEIWQDVLERKEIGIHDNYFFLGGDSIRGIQVVSRMLREKFNVRIRDLFQYPTVYELAQHITGSENHVDMEDVSGEFPLTPGQIWKLNDPSPNFEFRILHARKGFSRPAVESVLKKIQQHHDVLRVTFKNKAGQTIQENHGQNHPFSFQVINLKNNSDVTETMLKTATEITDTVRPETGPLLQSVLFHADQGDNLMIMIHRLLMDDISWKILIEDFATGYAQALSGKPVVLPAKTDSFKSWAQQQNATRSPVFRSDRLSGADSSEDGEPKKASGYRQIDINVGIESLKEANKAYGTHEKDLLIAALTQTLKNVTDPKNVHLIVLDDQRKSADGKLNLRRTVGCFACPVLFDPEIDGAVKDPGSAVKQVKEMLRKQPYSYNDGCRDGHSSAVNLFNGKNIPEDTTVGFMLRIQDNTDNDQVRDFDVVDIDPRPLGELSMQMNFHAIIGTHQLKIILSYDPSLYTTEQVRDLSDDYEKQLAIIIEHCTSRKGRELTPADLTYKGLTLEDLDGIFS